MEASPAMCAKCSELVKLVLGLVLDSNFKIALTSMQILTIIASKVKSYIEPTLFILVPNVVEKFADSKIAIRNGAKEVIRKVIDVMGPGPIFEILLGPSCFQKSSRNISAIREEILNIIIRDLLVYYEYNFDIILLIQRLVVGLSVTKEKVYQITLDTILVLHQRNPSRFFEALSSCDISEEISQLITANIKTGRTGFIGEDGNVHFSFDKKEKPIDNNNKNISGKRNPLKNSPSLPGAVDPIPFTPFNFPDEYEQENTHRNRTQTKQKDHSNHEFYTPSNGITRRRKDSTKSLNKSDQNSDLNVTDFEEDRFRASNPTQDSQNTHYDPLSTLRSRGKTRTFSARSNAIISQNDEASDDRSEWSISPPESMPQSATTKVLNIKRRREVLALSGKMFTSEATSRDDHVVSSSDSSPESTCVLSSDSTIQLDHDSGTLQTITIAFATPKNPREELKCALDYLESTEWDKNNEGIEIIRRLASEHVDIIAENIHSVLTLVMNMADSLRSGLAKNAIICTGELFQFLPKQMENELELVVPRLIRRYCESSAFLVKEVDKALENLVENIPRSKSVNTMLLNAKHKHTNVRNKCAYFMANCLELMFERELSHRDIERMLPIIHSFTQEGNGETRNSGKKAAVHLARLLNNPKEFALLAKRSLSDKQVDYFLDIIEKENSRNSKKQTLTIKSKISPIFSRKAKT